MPAVLAEILYRLLPPRRARTNPRVIKRKMANWPLKRAQHRQPDRPPDPAITIIAATKPRPTKRTPTP